MSALLNKIKSRMYIASYRKASHALEGEYLSLMRGRSMDFDDLREYAYGDDIKDIDWKASARSTHPLIKRYIANRKQPVLFIVDAGLGMNAITDSGETKKDIAVMIMGTLGYLAVRHSDTVGLIYGDAETAIRMPNRETESHLERILEKVDGAITLDSKESDVLKQIDFFNKSTRTRGLVVIIADEIELNDEFDNALKKLKARHEVLWMSVNDGNPLTQIALGEGSVRDIETNVLIPDYIRSNKKLRNLFEQEEHARKFYSDEYLKRMRISHANISTTNMVVPVLLRMLERRLRERRK